MSTSNRAPVFFDPSDKEVIKKYLIPKLKNELREDFIVMKDVYAAEPWLLDHTNNPFFKKNEWYYFATRTQISQKNIGCGKNSKRKITRDNGSGNWKVSVPTKDIVEKETKKTIGQKQILNFNKSNNNTKKQKKGDGTSCAIAQGSNNSWNMTEYMVLEENKYQELVLCKIHTINKKDDLHEASTSRIGLVDHESVVAASLSNEQQQRPINEARHHDAEIPSIGSVKNDDQAILCNIQAIMDDHHHIDSSSSEQQPIMSGALLDIYKSFEALLMTNSEDKLQPPISAPAHMDVVTPAHHGIKSLPAELYDYSKEDEEREAFLSSLTLEAEDAPNLQFMDQDQTKKHNKH